MKFNYQKVDAELRRTEKDRKWLSDELGMTRQAISWHFHNPERVPLRVIQRYAKVLNLDPKDLIR